MYFSLSYKNVLYRNYNIHVSMSYFHQQSFLFNLFVSRSPCRDLTQAKTHTRNLPLMDQASLWTLIQRG